MLAIRLRKDRLGACSTRACVMILQTNSAIGKVSILAWSTNKCASTLWNIPCLGATSSLDVRKKHRMLELLEMQVEKILGRGGLMAIVIGHNSQPTMPQDGSIIEVED